MLNHAIILRALRSFKLEVKSRIVDIKMNTIYSKLANERRELNSLSWNSFKDQAADCNFSRLVFICSLIL